MSQPIAIIKLNVAEPGKSGEVKDNFEANKGSHGKNEEKGKWTPGSVPFPEDSSGKPDPKYMLIEIGSGSTTWCYYLADGTKVCYSN